jgi:polyisoprenoid-binding protein YceI
MRSLALLFALGLLLFACEQKPAQTAVAAPAAADSAAADPFVGEIAKASIADPAAPAPIAGTAFLASVNDSKIFWRGKKVAYRHYGTINLAGAKLFVKDGQLTGGKVELDMNSIVDLDLTDPAKNAELVGHLKSDDFFSVAQHPNAVLEIVSVAPGENGMSNLAANLTIKGITHQIAFPVKVSVSADKLTAKALFSIDRAKWDVRFNSGSFFENLGDKLILDDIDFSLDLVAAPAPTASAQ